MLLDGTGCWSAIWPYISEGKRELFKFGAIGKKLPSIHIRIIPRFYTNVYILIFSFPVHRKFAYWCLYLGHPINESLLFFKDTNWVD